VERRTQIPVSLFDVEKKQFSSTRQIIDGTVAILQSAGTALAAIEIYHRLLANGITVSGKKPRANMTAKFSTRKDLLRFSEASQKWSLVKWETKDAWIGETGAPTTPDDDEPEEAV
jgi:hypothetical protein